MSKKALLFGNLMIYYRYSAVDGGKNNLILEISWKEKFIANLTQRSSAKK